ncbi:MAG TPA: ATP-binding protein [Thermoleophilia bacterium]|nr:ATP-binding protein [Thermoleophilia bacterium]
MVDDEEALCEGVRRIVEKYHVHVADVLVDVTYSFHSFGSGDEFLSYLDEGGSPDLLLLDLQLPRVGGMEVLDELTRRGRDMLTIVITAYATFDTAVKAMRLGAYDFLAKPFAPDELRYALRKTTDHLILSRQARRLANEKRQVRYDFISVLAHELKTPLNAVEGYLNILRNAEHDENLRMIERSIARVEGMKRLIGDLLDLTRIESGRQRRVVRGVDLGALAAASMDLVAADATLREITMALEVEGAVGLDADPSEIEMVFNNLVSNAVKYNRDGGTVIVHVSRDGDTVHIRVDDTGIGLTEEECAKLFTEFRRIKNRHTAGILGTGLGLSTIRRIATMYDGAAEVHSIPGAGSTFAVTLRDAAETEGGGWRELDRV